MASHVDPQNEVSLLIGGKVHSTWSTYSIDSDLMTPADAWEVGLGLPEKVFPLEIKAGVAVEVRVGADPVLRGRVDTVTRRTGRPQRALKMSGRDNAAILVDCSAPIFVAKEVTLAEIVAKVVRPLGITRVRIDADSAGGANEKINVEPGSTAWDVLQQAAEANGLWPWFEPDGTLVVGGPDYSTPPVATLIERFDGKGNNTLVLEHTSSINDRHSEVTVLAQGHGTGASNGQNAIRATAKDAEMAIYRPLIVTNGDMQNSDAARSFARKLLTDGRLAGETLSAVVKGHRTSDGVLWTPGQRVHVKSESLGIDAIWFLMGRQFIGGRENETVTILALKEDGVWTLDAYQKRKKGRKGKKLEAVILDVS